MTTVNKIFIEHFYKLLADFVKYNPPHSKKCKRLQTFAALSSYAELNSPNLGKTANDRGKPFFWSRDWASTNYNPSALSYSYPALSTLMHSITGKDTFNKRSERCYNIEIALLDKYDEDCADKGKNCKGCAGRTREEIYIGTESLLCNLFGYLRNVSYIENTNDDGKHDGLYNNEVYEQIATTIGGDVNTKLSARFLKSLSRNNSETQINLWTGGADNLFGHYVQLSLCFDYCDEYTFDPHIKEYKFGYDRNCCD